LRNVLDTLTYSLGLPQSLMIVTLPSIHPWGLWSVSGRRRLYICIGPTSATGCQRVCVSGYTRTYYSERSSEFGDLSVMFIPGFVALGPTSALSVKGMSAYAFVAESSSEICTVRGFWERFIVFERWRRSLLPANIECYRRTPRLALLKRKRSIASMEVELDRALTYI
jgi:hypothetical protein